MPQSVQMPDGITLEFPDGMSREAMRSAIASKFPSGESPDVAEPLLKQAERTSDVAAAGKRSLGHLRNQETWAKGLAMGEEMAAKLQPDTILPETLKAAVELPQRLVHEAANLIPGVAKTEFTPAPPAIPPEHAKAVLDFFDPASQPSEGSFHQGAKEALAGAISGMTSLENATALMAGTKEPEMVARIFQGTMLADVPKAIYDISQAKTPDESGKAWMNLGLQLGFYKAIDSHVNPKADVSEMIDTARDRGLERQAQDAALRLSDPRTAPLQLDKPLEPIPPENLVRGDKPTVADEVAAVIPTEGKATTKLSPTAEAALKAAEEVGPATKQVVKETKPNEVIQSPQQLRALLPATDEAVSGGKADVPIDPAAAPAEGAGASVAQAPSGEVREVVPEGPSPVAPSRGTISFETYDEPTGQWQKQNRPIVVSRSTIPGDKPWRATVFAGPADDPVAIGHIQLDSPEQATSPKAIAELSDQLGRYTRKVEINLGEKPSPTPTLPKAQEQGAKGAKPPELIAAEEATQSAFEKLGAAEKGAYDKSKRRGMTKAQLKKLGEFDKLAEAEQAEKAKWKSSQPKPPPPNPPPTARKGRRRVSCRLVPALALALLRFPVHKLPSKLSYKSSAQSEPNW